MNVTRTALDGVLILEPEVHGDERGFFLESWNRSAFQQATGLDPAFVQDNHSRSSRGVLRGLHYQLPPRAQCKLVRVTHGAVFDVAVDIRRHSPTFGRWVSAELTAANHRQLWIPHGFAHGFVVLSESADLHYKVTDFYAPECERAIRYDDTNLAITWPLESSALMVGPRDRGAPLFEQAVLFD